MNTIKRHFAFASALFFFCFSATWFLYCQKTAPATAPAEINLALNKSATANASYDSNCGPEKAIDGDTTTAWNSGKYHPGFLEIDLQESYTINSIVVMLSQSPAGQTAFQAWVYDGIDSTMAARWSGYTKLGSRLEARFSSPLEGIRKVRICSESSPSWISFFEVTVLGYPQ